MNDKVISEICQTVFTEPLSAVSRFSTGIGNYVFRVECADKKYIVRCSSAVDAYRETICLLKKLKDLQIPVPEVIAGGRACGYDYLVLTYMEGEDLGIAYPQLTAEDKRAIATEIVAIQNRVAALELEKLAPDWSWKAFVGEMLSRAKTRISENGYFSVDKVDLLWQEAAKLEAYFASIKPEAYLDDISSKNLLIHNGRISGIIDVDWMGVGDKLTYVALTNMALLDLEYTTDYVSYILEEMQLSEIQFRAFQFYTLMYCVDFMGERGMTFMDKRVEVSPPIIAKLNGIYDSLLQQWYKL